MRPDRWRRFISEAGGPAFVAVAYLAGAEAAFFVGTLSDNIFAPFWPPNVILLCALLLVPKRKWWAYIATIFPVHVVAEIGVGMPVPQLLVAFATNCAVAVASALLLIRITGRPPWLGSLRNTGAYILVAAFIVPAVVALGGAFVPILGGGPIEKFWIFWGQWYASNVLSALTLGPAFLVWLQESPASSSLKTRHRRIEAALLGLALVVVCTIVFEMRAGTLPSSFLPALLYAPLPLILWSAMRFGEKGASGAILIVAIVLVSSTLHTPNLFLTGDPETNVLAVQVFLIAISVPLLLLGSSIDESRRSEQTRRDSEERIAFTAAATNTGLWQFDAATKLFWTTDHCRSVLGLAGDRPLTLERFLSVIHPEDRMAARRLVQSTESIPVEHELRLTPPGDQMRWIIARLRPRFDTLGRQVGTSGIVVDITERKLAQQAIEKTRGLLASTLDAMSSEIAILDEAGHIMVTNEAWNLFLRRTGHYIPRDGIGQNYLNLPVLRPVRADLAAYRAGLTAVLDGEQDEFRCNFRAHIHNERRNYRIHAARFHSDGWTRIVVARDDVTELLIAREDVDNLASRLVNLQERERQRYASELHDSTVQHLTAMNLNLMALRGKIALRNDTAALFDDIERSLEEAHREIRSVSYLLYPRNLDYDGLALTLERFVDGFAQRTRIVTDIRLPDGLDALPASMQRSVLRIVQEALTNVHRHASATQVRIELAIRRNKLSLLIADNGKGFAAARKRESEQPTGVGMPGMKARVHQFGGHVTFRTGPKGTRVFAQIPLTQRAVRAAQKPKTAQPPAPQPRTQPRSVVRTRAIHPDSVPAK